MSEGPSPAPFEVSAGGLRLAGETDGEGPPIVLLHGLTATRRYVVHGSRMLSRRGYRLAGYDARGHGASSPAPEPSAYEYADLVRDLSAVLDALDADRAVLAGHSMGAATALAFTLENPGRVAALALITPAYPGRPLDDPDRLAQWDRLAEGMRRDGVEGFMAAYDPPIDDRWKKVVLRFTRQRLERHEHPEAVADAMEVVPRSVAFEGLEALEAVEAPALVVASRDEADPGHPLEVAARHAEHLPRAELEVDEPGDTPLAWQGARLSRRIADFLAAAGIEPG
jgi:pimeloyl-ACP methyl ester carboxylesterase